MIESFDLMIRIVFYLLGICVRSRNFSSKHSWKFVSANLSDFERTTWIRMASLSTTQLTLKEQFYSRYYGTRIVTISVLLLLVPYIAKSVSDK